MTRPCQGCGGATDLFYKGPWCARCGLRELGAVIGTLSRIESPFDGHARPPRRLGTGSNLSSERLPSSGEARPAGSLDRPEPPPLTDAEFDEGLRVLLAAEGWREA